MNTKDLARALRRDCGVKPFSGPSTYFQGDNNVEHQELDSLRPDRGSFRGFYSAQQSANYFVLVGRRQAALLFRERPGAASSGAAAQ
jgi:hypothetical protein